MVERSRLNLPFMLFMIAYAASSQFTTVPQGMRDMLDAWRRGWLQSRVNEKGNKVLRDSENRDNASKVQRMLMLWDKLQASQLLEEFGRHEVEQTSEEATPPKEELEALFKDVPRQIPKPDVAAPSQERKDAERKRKWYDKIAGVMDEKRFTGFTPETEQELHAEAVLLRTLHSSDNWFEVGNAWQASLLPGGGLVRRKADNAYFFVERAYHAAAIVWPAKQLEIGIWERDPSVEELQWLVVFDIDAYEDVPLRWASPLALLLQDLRGEPLCASPRLCFRFAFPNSSAKKHSQCIFSCGAKPGFHRSGFS